MNKTIEIDPFDFSKSEIEEKRKKNMFTSFESQTHNSLEFSVEKCIDLHQSICTDHPSLFEMKIIKRKRQSRRSMYPFSIEQLRQMNKTNDSKK